MSQQLEMAVIGLGGRGRGLGASFVQDPRVRMAAGTDIDPKIEESARNKIPGDWRFYTDNAQMLAKEKPDFCIVASTDRTHAEVVVQAMEAGVDVFLEKPMAQTIPDCDRIIRTAKTTGRRCLVGFELRNWTLFQEMKRLIDDGAIGDIKLGYAVDNVSVGGNYFFHNYYRLREEVVGLLIQKGCHTIDIFTWAVGAKPARVYASGGLDVFGRLEPPDKRCCDCDLLDSCPYAIKTGAIATDYGAALRRPDNCVYSKEVDISDNAVVIIDYENGVRMQFLECHFTPEYTREFTFIGDRGKMYAFYNNEGHFVIRVSHRHSNHIDEYRPPKGPGGHGGGDLGIQKEFIEGLLDGRDWTRELIEARESTAIAIAAEESAHTGKVVTIPRLGQHY